MILFDYIYYRICRYYAATHEPFPGLLGQLTLSLIQALLFVNLLMFLRIVGHVEFPHGTPAAGVLPLLLLLVFINFRRYRRYGHDHFAEKWDTARHQRILGIITFIFCSGTLLIPVTVGIGEYLAARL